MLFRSVQQGITEARYAERVGTRAIALVERGRQARLPWQADDIDGVTHLDDDVAPGSLVEVDVTDTDEYDFHARVLRVMQAPATPVAPSGRVLPLASLGAFGR